MIFGVGSLASPAPASWVRQLWRTLRGLKSSRHSWTTLTARLCFRMAISLATVRVLVWRLRR